MKKLRTIKLGVVMFLLAAQSFAAPPPTLDANNWRSFRNVNDEFTEVPGNAVQAGDTLKLLGFNLGTNPQYSLDSSVSSQFDNENVTFRVVFQGELVHSEASFLAFVLRATSAQTVFWAQPCYALLLKDTKIEVQKHGRGSNPNLTYKYQDFPQLGFDRLPVGEPLEITFGAINEGRIPRITVAINGVEMANFRDMRYGQSVRRNPNDMLQIGLFATNREREDEVSKSSLTVLSIE